MLALDFLRVACAWAVLVGVQMPAVGTPMIRVVPGQSEGLEQRFELQKDLVCAARYSKQCGPNSGANVGWGSGCERSSMITSWTPCGTCSRPCGMVGKRRPPSWQLTLPH